MNSINDERYINFYIEKNIDVGKNIKISMYVNRKEEKIVKNIIRILYKFNNLYNINNNKIVKYIEDIFNCSNIMIYEVMNDNIIIKDYLMVYSLFDFIS